ncbi:sigma-54 interaction domain-containing protein [Desulfosoma sp.]
MASARRALISGLFSRPVECAAVFNDLPDALVFLSPNRRVLYLNRAAEVLTGLSRQDAQGLPCRHVVRSNVCAGQCPLDDLSRDSGPVCRQADVINRDRRRVPVRLCAVMLRDVRGAVVGFMEVLEDLRSLENVETRKGQAYQFGRIVGRSPAMERLFAILPGIAQTDSSVLITGETGTGKDLLAEAIHQLSARAKGPFVKVNCGALPETLLESELFGHQKGAFTGATENKPGRFRLAHNGTLFLTEIGDLPLPLQVKLLTFLDDHVIYPLGSTKGTRVDVRVIAATHRDLQAMVREGKFRQDLLYRLNVVRVHIPPLRERGEDVRLLLDHFLAAFVSDFHKHIKGFSKDALKCLLEYPYPGNVRELKNIVEYAVNVCQEETIQIHHLPSYMTEVPVTIVAPRPEGRDMEGEEAVPKGAVMEAAQGEGWAEMERRLIVEALVRANGRRGRAAQILGWGRSTLWRKMKQYGLLERDEDASSQGGS